jgi:feruloyl esterase
LTSLTLPNTTITMAKPVAAGEFTPSGPTPPGANFKGIPAFCRVAATLAPSKDSDIKIEVWMPASDWNGKFQAVGNGGWSGAIVYPSLARALAHGYATASTDTGHSGGSGSFALGHPEKLLDFGYRAGHEMTVQAKAIITAYYGNGPRLSYWTHLMTGELWIAQATHKDEASFIPASKYPIIHKAVLEACDALDGVKDGVLEDPRKCHFDPKTIQCQGDDTSNCLTVAQVETARKIYAASKNPRTGQEIFPGLEPGSELGWAGLTSAQPFPIPVDHFKYVVFKDPNYDWRTLNFDSDIALADKIDNGTINATDPNLKAFLGHGGKLLLYHGWNDQLIAPRNAINYYQSVLDTMGGASKVADSVRLFMAPGMNHCAGGDGPGAIDTVSVIEKWVEQGQAPDQIVASHISGGAVDRTRPLCAYPKVAQYKGSGSTDEAANFVCKLP